MWNSINWPKKKSFDQTPNLTENFDQLKMSSEIQSTDPLSCHWLAQNLHRMVKRQPIDDDYSMKPMVTDITHDDWCFTDGDQYLTDRDQCLPDGSWGIQCCQPSKNCKNWSKIVKMEKDGLATLLLLMNYWENELLEMIQANTKLFFTEKNNTNKSNTIKLT